MRKLDGASSNRARAALHYDSLSLDGTRDMNSPMSGYAGNTETGTLLQWHVLRESSHLPQRNHGVLGGRAERPVRLSAVAPYALADPIRRDTFADCVHGARTIAVWNHTWIW